MRTPDDIITWITEAGTKAEALTVMARVPHRMLMAVADQLHIDPHGHADPWLRKAIVAEARA